MNDIQQRQQQPTTMADFVGGRHGVPGSWGHTAKVATGTFTFPDHPWVHVRDYSYAFPYADSYHGRVDVPPTAQAPKPHHWTESDLPTPEPLINEESTTSNTSLTQQRNITLGTLGMAWVLFAMLTAMSLHRTCKPRFIQRKKIATVRSYLTRFKDKDVKVFKSPPGGLNVLYHQKRLVNRLKYYWSGELPDPDDSSTILFENDVEDQHQPSLHACWTFSCSDGYMEGDSCSRATVSSSSQSQTSASSRASYHTQTQANSQGTKTKDMRRRLRTQNNIIHVLENSSISLVDVRLGDSSISGDGFSVTYRRSLRDRMEQGAYRDDDNDDDDDDEEVIDFQAMTPAQSGQETLLSSFPELEILHGEELSVSGGDEVEDIHMEAGEANNSNFW